MEKKGRRERRTKKGGWSSERKSKKASVLYTFSSVDFRFFIRLIELPIKLIKTKANTWQGSPKKLFILFLFLLSLFCCCYFSSVRFSEFLDHPNIPCFVCFVVVSPCFVFLYSENIRTFPVLFFVVVAFPLFGFPVFLDHSNIPYFVVVNSIFFVLFSSIPRTFEYSLDEPHACRAVRARRREPDHRWLVRWCAAPPPVYRERAPGRSSGGEAHKVPGRWCALLCGPVLHCGVRSWGARRRPRGEAPQERKPSSGSHHRYRSNGA